MLKTRLLSLMLVFALLGVACGSDDASTDSSSSATAADVADAEPTEPPAPTATPAPEPTAEPEPEPEPTEEPTPESAPEPTAVPEPAAAFDINADGCAADVDAGITTVDFEFEGRQRTYDIQVPASYSAGTAVPVVLNWHGLGSNGPEQLLFSDYLSLADQEGFVVVAATGVASPGDAEARNSWELTPDADPGRDDLAFANYLLDHVIATVCVDQSRVYSTGMSNGGFFTGVLICGMADRIAAGASVAGLTFDDSCSPSRAVPYIAFHGVDDAVVPFAGGGESSLAPGQTLELFERKIVDEFDQFAESNGCSDEPVIEPLTDNVTAYDYESCDVEMTFYEIAGAGHTWPGSATSLAVSEIVGLGVTTPDINASVVSWEFFSRHSLEG